ncbi:hypothetical protein V8C26DRAFT_413072 [Trichoderma gracile]
MYSNCFLFLFFFFLSTGCSMTFFAWPRENLFVFFIVLSFALLGLAWLVYSWTMCQGGGVSRARIYVLSCHSFELQCSVPAGTKF